MTFPPWAARLLADHSSLEIPRLVKPVGRVVLAPVVDMGRMMRILTFLRSNPLVDECALGIEKSRNVLWNALLWWFVYNNETRPVMKIQDYPGMCPDEVDLEDSCLFAYACAVVSSLDVCSCSHRSRTFPVRLVFLHCNPAYIRECLSM